MSADALTPEELEEWCYIQQCLEAECYGYWMDEQEIAMYKRLAEKVYGPENSS